MNKENDPMDVDSTEELGKDSVQTEEHSQADDAGETLAFTDGAENAPAADSNATPAEKLQDAEGRAARAQAELDNFRKRTRREMGEREKFASLNLMKEMLQVVDNLQLAIQAAEGKSEDSTLLQGVQMVKEQFIEAMSKHHCKRIEAVGQSFRSKFT